MRIAVISMIRNSWGGSEELWYEMAKLALSKGHEVIHLSYKHPHEHYKLAELKSLGLISYTRPGITGNVSGLARFIRLSSNFVRKKIQKPVKAIFRRHPDVILYNGTCYSIADEKEIVKELRKFNKKFFLLCHFNERKSPPAEREKIILKEVYQKCAAIFFTNYHDVETTKKDLNINLPNPTVIRNPVNLSDNTTIPYPQKGPSQMAMVGNLIVVHKGQDIAINILRKEAWKKRSWHLNIYGTGPDEEYLKLLTQKHNLKDRVTFHGQVRDIRSIWQNNHLLLMPSRMEGMPLAIVEAMLCGRPCVVTSVGGIPEWIQEGKSGFLANSTNAESFEDALEKAWTCQNEWEAIGKYAHHTAAQLYDPNPGNTLLELISKQE